MNELSEFIEKVYSLPDEIVTDKEFLYLKKEDIDKVMTTLRKRIIHLLFEQNPVNEKKLSELFQQDVHKDLAVLNHLGLIKIEKIDGDTKHNIITLNRKIKLI